MSHTCTHIYDTGGLCQSFAVKGQRYCVHHLRYRARRLRAAQARARGERFVFHLPPLDSMHDVHSALSQLAEAIAAGVIDRHSTHALLSVLRVASRNLLHPDKWRPNLYESAEPAPDVDVAAEQGLPAGLDIDTPPNVAFPPSPLEDAEQVADRVSASAVLKGHGFSRAVQAPCSCRPEATLVAEGPAFSSSSTGSPGGPPLPEVGNCGSADTPTVRSIDPFHQLNCLERVTPIDIELEEINRSQGNRAMLRHADKLERDELRRKRTAETRAAYQRYAVVAFHRNLERLAEKLANEKLANEKLDHLQSGQDPAQPSAAPKPPAPAPAIETSQNSALTPTG